MSTYNHSLDNEGSPTGYLSYTFGTPKTVQCVYLAYRDLSWTHRNDINFNVGISTNPYDNAECFANALQTGWYSCYSPLTGDYFGVSRDVDFAFTIREIWVFSEYFIQHNYWTVTMTSLESGSSASNALQALGSMWSATLLTSSTTDLNDKTPSLTVTFRAFIKIKTFVIIPNIDYMTNYEFYGTKNDDSNVCQFTEADLNGNHEFSCDEIIKEFTISRTGG